MSDNLHTGKETIESIVRGIRKCANAVGSTMGTAGHNALVEVLENPGHLLTNDGATILAAIHLEDPLEEIGRKLLLEAVSRANKASGDGSSTTTVLTAAILEEGLKHLGSNNPMAIKKSIEDCIPLIEVAINDQTKQVVTDGILDYKLLQQVATISAEDDSIGAMIADIYGKIGTGGIIHWDISKTFEDSYTIGTGITVNGAGLASPYFADMNEATGRFTNQLRWRKPLVLLAKQKITSAGEFNDLFAKLDANGTKEVVIFCDEYEPTVIPPLVQTRIQRGFKAVLVKMPVLWKDWWYEDLARVTRATIIDGIGLKLKDVTQTHLGTCENIVVDKDNAYLDGTTDVTDHLKALEEDGSDDAKLRISRLNTKTARYFVGAKSDSALSYRRLKVEDAINSAYHAIRHGIVAGGGVALRNCADSIENKVLQEALRKPFKQILSNAGIEAEVVYTPVGGYDTRTGELVNMFEAGIVDSAEVVRNAVINAVSVAATVLTASVVVQLPRQSFTDTLIQEILSKKQ